MMTYEYDESCNAYGPEPPPDDVYKPNSADKARWAQYGRAWRTTVTQNAPPSAPPNHPAPVRRGITGRVVRLRLCTPSIDGRARPFVGGQKFSHQDALLPF